MDELKEVRTLEKELRHCLQHVQPPVGFTDRVMARVAGREAARAKRPTVRAAWRAGFAAVPKRGWWTAAAAALLLAIGGGDALHLHHQRQERETAAVQAQMELAMQLTNHALNRVETGLDRSPAGKFSQLWNGTER